MNQARLEIPTRCAHWGWTDHRYFGHSVFGELLGHESFMGLLVLSITGRRCTPDIAAVLDQMATAALLGDPRIWPLKMIRLIASYGGRHPAVAAGLAIFESARVGPNANTGAARDLLELHAAIDGRFDDPERVRSVVQARLTERPFVWGFGVPFRERDERLAAFRDCLVRAGRDGLPYFRTMDAVAGAMRTLTQQEPNMAAGAAAACLDMGFSALEIGLLTTAVMETMLYANAAEGATQSPAVLQCLPTEYISYYGRAARVSPRESAERKIDSR